ncbi:hypothetical protein DMH18_17925 [Streptomyces sp. WAC 06783]|nr:hypothetical protein DMH18_17925 [Streptomyces sp. WAC 06783]
MEHTFRLLKQTLGWAKPRLRSRDEPTEENALLPVPLAWSALQGHSVEGRPASPGSRRCPGRPPNFSAGSRPNTKKAGARRSISQEHLRCNNAN